MKYINKKTGEIKEAKTYSQFFAFSHNSNYELYKEENKKNKNNKKEQSNEEEIVIS